MRVAKDQWREIKIKLRQRLNMKKRRLVGQHIRQMISVPHRKHVLFYQADQTVCAGHKRSGALGISTPVVFSYTMDKTQLGTDLEREMIQNVIELLRWSTW